MTAEEFRQMTELYITLINNLIAENIKSTGNTSDTCQQVNMANRLYQFEHAVNATTDEDMIDPTPL